VLAWRRWLPHRCDWPISFSIKSIRSGSIRLYLSLSTYSVRLPLCFRSWSLPATPACYWPEPQQFHNPINRDHIKVIHMLSVFSVTINTYFPWFSSFRKCLTSETNESSADRFSNLLMLEPDSVTIQASATISASANGKRIFWLINYLLGFREFQHAGIRTGSVWSRPSCPFARCQYKQYYSFVKIYYTLNIIST